MHIPVLLHESLQGLNLDKHSDSKVRVFVDGTVNGGGHAQAVAEAYGKAVKIIGIDLDSQAIERSRAKLEKTSASFELVCDSYVNMHSILEQLEVLSVDAVLFDFGLSSDQYESGRGFSFQKDEPLLMTFKKDPGPSDVTARDVVNDWELESLKTIIYGFAEERYAGRIAQAIVDARIEGPIETTGQLAQIISDAVPAAYRRGRIHPATRTFQALRIAVNGELQSVERGLKVAMEVLAPGGRLCAISFHSLEDRIVKRYFKSCAELGEGTIVTKRPIVASQSEISENPRSRSAKLRIFQKN